MVYGREKLHFETLQVHVGQNNQIRQRMPVQYLFIRPPLVFHNAAHAAARFSLQDAGNIYGRLTNSTQGYLNNA